MGPCLRAAIAQRNLSSEEEADLVQPVNLFESLSQGAWHHNDVKIYYVEACLARAVTGIPAQFLITNNHRFFKMFPKSTVAEDTFNSDKHGVQEGCELNSSERSFVDCKQNKISYIFF